MREYRVSDVAIDASQSVVSKKALEEKLNRLVAEGWDVEDVLQAGDTWFIKSSRETK